MKDFFNGMSLMEQMYWMLALTGTLIFIIIFIITFFGKNQITDFQFEEKNVKSNYNKPDFHFFTLKNILAFFTIFGWTGLVCLNNRCNINIALFTSVLSGIIMMVLMSFVFSKIYKISVIETSTSQNMIGNIGVVNLPIKAQRKNIGLVKMGHKGNFIELEAVTDSEIDIPSGAIIKVVKVVGSEILLVEKL